MAFQRAQRAETPQQEPIGLLVKSDSAVRTTAACCKTMSAHSTAARSGSKEHGREGCVALWSPLVSNMAQALRLRSRVMDTSSAMDACAHQKQRFTQKQSFRCRERSKWSLVREAMTKERVEVVQAPHGFPFNTPRCFERLI